MEELIIQEKKNLEKLNIHELRSLGKKTGVKAPAALNKSELICQIVEIRFGEREKVKETRGRPMRPTKIDHMYNAFPSFGEISVTCAAGYVDPYKNSKAKSNTQKFGIFELQNDGYGIILVDNFIYGDDDAYVSVDMTSQYNLKDGDSITFKSKRVNKKNIVTKIYTINNIEADVIKTRVDYKMLKPSYPTEKYNLVGADGLDLLDMIAPIGRGSRGIIVGSPKCGKSKLATAISINLAQNNDNCFVSPIVISKSMQDISELMEEDKLASVFTLVNWNPADSIRAISLGINRAMRYAELGKDVVVVIDDLNSCYKAYTDLLILNDIKDADVISWIKSIFALGGKLSNGGSFSVIGVLDDSEEEGKKLKKELNQVVDYKIGFDKELMNLRLFPCISIADSYSKITDKVLTGDKLKQSDELRRNYLLLSDKKQKIEFFDKYYLSNKK